MALPQVLVAGVVCLIVAGGAQGESDRLMRRAVRVFEAIETPAPGDGPAAPDVLALGERLFSDSALSVDGTRSCATCHRVDGGAPGVDGRVTSDGAGGKPLSRNTPSVYNVALSDWYFWDGRSDDLESILGEHLADPSISGFENQDALRTAIEGRGINPDTIVPAIAGYLRSLITPGRFDAFLNGDATALNEIEREGLRLFFKTSCNKCHDGTGIGGTSRERLGEFGSYANQQDQGLFAHTGDEADRMVFKAPALRNVALTAPYFHDGKVASLAEAVELMARLQQDVELSKAEIEAIVAFLGTLSGAALAP